MKTENKKNLFVASALLLLFVLWTVTIKTVDVQSVGPQGSEVGFATINCFVHNLTGVHMSLYHLTDWLSLIPLGFIAGFGLLGLVQWIKRKHIFKVDYTIFVLGGFYAVVMAVFLFFEAFAVNYRPILIEGVLEASYPSSTTMLVMCVMPTAVMQLNSRIRNNVLKKRVSSVIIAFTVFMVIARLISGVHWFSDIVAGALLSTGLVMMYRFFRNLKNDI